MLPAKLMIEGLVLFAFTIALQVHAIVAFCKVLLIRTIKIGEGGRRRHTQIMLDFRKVVQWCMYRTLEAVLIVACAYYWWGAVQVALRELREAAPAQQQQPLQSLEQMAGVLDEMRRLAMERAAERQQVPFF